jgi:hypothetical protein
MMSEPPPKQQDGKVQQLKVNVANGVPTAKSRSHHEHAKAPTKVNAIGMAKSRTSRGQASSQRSTRGQEQVAARVSQGSNQSQSNRDDKAPHHTWSSNWDGKVPHVKIAVTGGRPTGYTRRPETKLAIKVQVNGDVEMEEPAQATQQEGNVQGHGGQLRCQEQAWPSQALVAKTTGSCHTSPSRPWRHT